jgi:hypothetical protein
MAMTSVETNIREATNYGGLVDALGGAATVVLAIIGLAGTKADMLLAIATVVFGAALLIQSGTILSELTHMMFPPGASTSAEEFSGGGLSTVFLVGMAGIVLGVLALLGIFPVELIAIAVIAFGGALVFGSNAVWSVHRMKRAFIRTMERVRSPAPKSLPPKLRRARPGCNASPAWRQLCSAFLPSPVTIRSR